MCDPGIPPCTGHDPFEGIVPNRYDTVTVILHISEEMVFCILSEQANRWAETQRY